MRLVVKIRKRTFTESIEKDYELRGYNVNACRGQVSNRVTDGDRVCPLTEGHGPPLNGSPGELLEVGCCCQRSFSFFGGGQKSRL